MKQFFKYVLATIVGVVMSSLILIFIFFAIISITISTMTPSRGGQDVVVAANSILHITLDHEIVEQGKSSPFDNLNIPGVSSLRSIGLNDITSRIKAAKEDSNIKGIYLNVSTANAGFATLRAIREAIEDFKSSGKFVLAYGEVMSQKAYYISSVADEIYLGHEGNIDFRGLSSSVMFFKDAFEKLGIEMQVIKVGTYKSAVEPFILNSMSDANREQVTSYLSSIYDYFINDISASRKIDATELRNIADQYLIRSDEDAIKYKFADKLLYKDEVISRLKSKVGIEVKGDLKTVSLLDYEKSGKVGDLGADRIAILYASGDIVDGEGKENQIGGQSFSRELRELRENDKIKGVVLRVNSPGGSALASDQIWREVELTKKVKPIVVSMGDYAASGGYYISAAADSIFADPSTITGSIGVFGLIPNLKGIFNDKLGINVESVKTGKFAAMLTEIDEPLTAEERQIIQVGVNNIYNSFTKKVADGRRMSVSDVDSIGQGRVWTGSQAVELKLVDRLATLDEAVKSVALIAKIATYRVVEYPRKADSFSSLFEESKEKVKVWFLKDELGDQIKYLNALKRNLQHTGVQARLPYQLEIY